MGDLGSIPGLGRFPWRREQLFPPVFWPKELHGLYRIVHGVAKSQTWLSKFPSPRCRIAGAWKWKSPSRVWLFGTPRTIQSMDSPGQNAGVGSLPLLQGISPTQGSNPSLLHCRWISLPAEPQGKPRNTGVGSLSLLQQIFLTQESNWGLLNCRQIFFYLLSYQGSHMVGLCLIFWGPFVLFSIAVRYHVTIPPTVQFHAFFFLVLKT